MKNWAKSVQKAERVNVSPLSSLDVQKWSLETLKEFIVQEAEFHIVASETIRGVNTTSKSLEQKRNRKDSEKSTFFGGDQKTENHRKTAYMSRLCKVCNRPHGVWRCEKFKAMSVQERWDAAKRLHLCFHCLGGDHFGQTCVRTRICGINNCKDKRNRLLHTHRNQQHGIEQMEERSNQLMSDQNAPSGETSAGNSNQSVESERKPLVVSLPQDSADHQTKRSYNTTVAEHADVLQISSSIENSSCDRKEWWPKTQRECLIGRSLYEDVYQCRCNSVTWTPRTVTESHR